jgi:hypothetical protein
LDWPVRWRIWARQLPNERNEEQKREPSMQCKRNNLRRPEFLVLHPSGLSDWNISGELHRVKCEEFFQIRESILQFIAAVHEESRGETSCGSGEVAIARWGVWALIHTPFASLDFLSSPAERHSLSFCIGIFFFTPPKSDIQSLSLVA